MSKGANEFAAFMGREKASGAGSWCGSPGIVATGIWGDFPIE
jgi:hypothetical protein